MLDYYTLQDAIERLSTVKMKHTTQHIAMLCNDGKLTPLIPYNRYVMPIERIDSQTIVTPPDYTATVAYNGMLTHYELSHLLNGYEDSLKLEYATCQTGELEGQEVLLLAKDFPHCVYMLGETATAYSDNDSLKVTKAQILFSSIEVDALAEQTQTSQPKRAQTDESNTDKKLIAIMAILLAKQSNIFRIGDRPNSAQISNEIYKLAQQLGIDENGMLGLKAPNDKIGKAINDHASLLHKTD